MALRRISSRTRVGGGARFRTLRVLSLQSLRLRQREPESHVLGVQV